MYIKISIKTFWTEIMFRKRKFAISSYLKNLCAEHIVRTVSLFLQREKKIFSSFPTCFL